MSSIAADAVCSSTAATARIGSPSYRGSLVRDVSPGAIASGTSSYVRMPSKPGSASAALESSERTRAWGIGLTSSLQKTMPSARWSSAYLERPVTFA